MLLRELPFESPLTALWCMKRYIIFVTRVISLLFHGQFFLAALVVTSKVFPSWLFRVKKSVFLQAERSLENTKELEIFRSDETGIREMVRDIYQDKPKVQRFYQNFLQQGAECWCFRAEEKISGVLWLFHSQYFARWEGYDRYPKSSRMLSLSVMFLRQRTCVNEEFSNVS